jgi:hypothetical protein
MEIILQITGAVTAILAASFWFCSASINIPDMKDMKISGPGSSTDYMRKQSKWSAKAAISAGVSALLHALLIFYQIFQS